MGIRRTILAPIILTIGTLGSVAAGPVVALAATAPTAGPAVLAIGSPDVMPHHG